MDDITSEPKIDKFVTIIEDPDKGILFHVVGVTMDEALALVTKGYVKFQKQYEKYIRNQEV